MTRWLTLALSLFVGGLLCLDPPAKAWWQSVQQISVGGSTPATWNPLDKDAAITLSNSNRTAHGTGGNAVVRTAAIVTANQKIYYEIAVDNRGASPRIGFANSNHVLTDTLGSDNPSTGFALFLNSGLFYNTGENTQILAACCVNGDRIGMAFNSATMLFWARLNNGTWNVTSGGGDPVAGTGGMTVGASSSGPWMAAFQANVNTDQITANFASGNIVDTIPTGYTLLVN